MAASATDVIDPAAESPEFCLDCAEKHIGQARINVGEALDRLRNLKHLDDPSSVKKLTDFVLLHVNKAQAELAEVETHTKTATDASPEQREALDKIAHAARMIRDQLRNFNKSFPQAPNLELILAAEKKAEGLNSEILFTKKNFGCGACMANKEELLAIREKLLGLGAPLASEPPTSEALPTTPVVLATATNAADEKLTFFSPLKILFSETKKNISYLDKELKKIPQYAIDDIMLILRGDRSS